MMTRRRMMQIAALTLAVAMAAATLSPALACSPTSLQLDAAYASGNTIHLTISNPTSHAGSAYLNLDFTVGETSYAFSIPIQLAAHSSASVTITFTDPVVLNSAQVCGDKSGTTESPDPVVNIQVTRP